MKTYLSWSGGKDSTASIILCHERNIPLDGIIFCEVMFDNERNISGENPEHIDFIYNKAIPIIENRFGFNVTVLRAEKDYIKEFNTVITKSSHNDRIGKKHGFLLGGRCNVSRDMKLKLIRDWKRSVGTFQDIVGIAADEPIRLARLKENQRSVLFEAHITEAQTYDICRKYDLLSPIYEQENRGGCWFCPNSSIKDFARLAKHHPELWGELEKLSHTENLVSQGFKYGRTFESVNREVQTINNQMSIFDMV